MTNSSNSLSPHHHPQYQPHSYDSVILAVVLGHTGSFDVWLSKDKSKTYGFHKWSPSLYTHEAYLGVHISIQGIFGHKV
eukprot:14853184-Ditylum_brightwellii.AAC.1